MMKILHYKKYLHFAAAIICIIAMSFLAAWLWQNIEPQKQEILPKKVLKSPPKQAAVASKPVDHDLRDILSTNIFKQHKAITRVAVEQKKIPKTRQQLFLHGIINSSEPTHSIALISNQKKKSPLPYMQGDKLPSNAGTVHLILNSYVQIKRNGRLEKLELIKTRPLTKGSIKHTTASNNISSLSDIKSHYKNNKSQLFSRFGLTHTASGIKLSTRKGRLPPGLRDGDVITSMNGYSMTDLDNDLDLLDTILESEKIEATLERNGRTIHFNIPKKMLEQWK
ncbi:MAG: hypothetical protein GQ581_06785 [Methyloprofundus sp.]|nr:hypothetical protein [Methyloprofundus sp.]